MGERAACPPARPWTKPSAPPQVRDPREQHTRTLGAGARPVAQRDVGDALLSAARHFGGESAGAFDCGLSDVSRAAAGCAAQLSAEARSQAERAAAGGRSRG